MQATGRGAQPSRSRRRSRLLLLGLLLATVALGLATCRFPGAFPQAVATYGGDALWAAMVFWGAALTRPAACTRTLALVALCVSFGVEASQLVHVPWLDAVRATRLGALALGQGFLWSDLVSYAVGIALAAGLDGLHRARDCVHTPGMPRRSLLLLALLLLAACERATEFVDRRPVSATAHERYARLLFDAGLDSTALGREWLVASDSALRAAHTATLAAREAGVYRRDEARAVAWRLSLREGQRFAATPRTDGPPARLFLDLFEASGDSLRPFVHRASGGTVAPRADDGAATFDTGAASAPLVVHLVHEARRTGDYVLRLQPELLRAGRYEPVLEVGPTLAFPVEGRDNRAIGSYFGADRDAGRRVHHGIDSFAPRGTPAIAATDGAVRSTRPDDLGGTVVWLRDEAREPTLYYAHLDAHAVVEGQVVRRGDTIGFVGNTGNARTTPPHLHFGIYRRGQGPVDPLPHVRIERARAPQIAADTPLRIMGASARWYRVHLDDGVAGSVTASAVRVAPAGSAAAP